MFWSFVIVCVLAAAALAGWVLAELELRDTHREIASLQADAELARGMNEMWDAIGKPTLHLVDGDKR